MKGRHVLDYGCGLGIEALQFARAGARVTLWDLTGPGLEAAQRILAIHGHTADALEAPATLPDCDLFYANGVLHHFPDGMKVLNAAPAPEAWIMVYSDIAWAQKGGENFWRAMDEVGGYADWYSPTKLAEAAYAWDVVRCRYITRDRHYLAATLRRP